MAARLRGASVLLQMEFGDRFDAGAIASAAGHVRAVLLAQPWVYRVGMRLTDLGTAVLCGALGGILGRPVIDRLLRLPPFSAYGSFVLGFGGMRLAATWRRSR